MMKKTISLMLTLILIIFCQIISYASNEVELNPAKDIPMPIGGLSMTAEEVELKDETVNLDDVTLSSDFETYFYNSLYEQQSVISLNSYNIPSTEFSNLYLKFAFSHPELMLIDNGFSYSVSGQKIYNVYPAYYVDKSKRENFLTIMENKINEYVTLVKDEPDELKKYLLIHDKMIRETHYDYTYSTNLQAHTVYSFFVNGATTCQGYSNALKLICDKVGLEVTYCYNRAKDVGHIWNLIKINGKWYHTDVTWDDYSLIYSNGSVNNENDQGAVHLYFLCSEETYTMNGHGYSSDYRTVEGTRPSCTDKTYEDDKWAFNINQGGTPYLTDFDTDGKNIYFDLVGAYDKNSNPLKLVANNLWGHATYMSLPLIEKDKAYYYGFSREVLPMSKLRLVFKDENDIETVKSYDVAGKGKGVLYSIEVPLDEETLTNSDSITMYNWAGLKPLAESNTILTQDIKFDILSESLNELVVVTFENNTCAPSTGINFWGKDADEKNLYNAFSYIQWEEAGISKPNTTEDFGDTLVKINTKNSTSVKGIVEGRINDIPANIINFAKGNMYKMSCWIYLEDVTNGGDSAKVTFKPYAGNSATALNCEKTFTIKKGEWTKLEVSFTSTKNEAGLTSGARFTFSTVNDDEYPQVAYIDNLMFKGYLMQTDIPQILLSSYDLDNLYFYTRSGSTTHTLTNGVLNLNVTETCETSSHILFGFRKLIQGIDEGDICLISFKVRVNEGYPYLNLVVEHHSSYKKSLFSSINMKTSNEWVTYYVPFKGLNGPNSVSVRFGMSIQNIDIKDFKLINYKSTVAFEDLPSSL